MRAELLLVSFFHEVLSQIKVVLLIWQKIRRVGWHGGKQGLRLGCAEVGLSPNNRPKALRCITRFPVNCELCLSPASQLAAKAKEMLPVEAFSLFFLKGYISTFYLMVVSGGKFMYL